MSNEEIKIQQKVKETKHKIVLFIVILISIFYWGEFTESFDTVESKTNTYDSLSLERDNIQSDISQAEDNLKDLDYLNENESEIFACLNRDECDIQDHFEDNENFNEETIRYYFSITKHEQEKMDFDQKLVLRSINEFLLNNNSSNPFGDLNIVSFWNVSDAWFYDWVYSLPISLNINFSNVDSLINFLEKIEEWANRSLPVLYEVDSVNYDIVSYDEEQTVNINLNAYFNK